MICPQCKTTNDDEYVFCVNCGISIGGDPYATIKFDPQTKRPIADRVPLPETVFVKKASFKHNTPSFDQPEITLDRYQEKKRSYLPLIIGITVIVISLAGGVIYFASRPAPVVEKPEALPDHIGLFWQKDNKSSIVEIQRRDFVNALEGRNQLLKDEVLAQVVDQPDLILYADASEVPLSDLKFIKLDTLTDDGKVKFIDFQAALIDGKPAMKRIRFEKPLETGRYAFALFSGFANEGKHRLWPMEVRNSTAPVGQFTQELSLSIKPAEASAQNSEPAAEVVQIPAGATIAYCTRKDVRLRDSAGLYGQKLDKLSVDQKVYVIRYSDTFDSWNGIYSNWAFVQTEKGKQGWVFNAFLDHGQK